MESFAPELTQEFSAVREATQEGILKNVDERHLPKRAPVVDNFCADFRRNYEATRHLAVLRGFNEGEDWQTHRLHWHGGALRIVPGSPTNHGLPPGADVVFLNEILEAPAVTGIWEVLLRAHFPCGKAGMAGMGFRDVLRELMKAKFHLREAQPKFRIITLLHVDYTVVHGLGKGMKNYYACPDAWQRGWR